MLTIAAAALSHDLYMARARMDASRSDACANAEWLDLNDEQRRMFLATSIESGEIHEDATQPHV